MHEVVSRHAAEDVRALATATLSIDDFVGGAPQSDDLRLLRVHYLGRKGASRYGCDR